MEALTTVSESREVMPGLPRVVRRPLLVAFAEGGVVQTSVSFEGVGMPELIYLDFDMTESSDAQDCNDFAHHVHEVAKAMAERGQPMNPAWISQADSAVVPVCDICDEPEGEGEADWNGETGNHETCESEQAEEAGTVVAL